MNYIKIPRELLKDKLTTVHFKVLCYFYCCCGSSPTGAVKTKLKSISHRCGIKDPGEISKITDELEQMGYIEKDNRHDMFGKYISTKYRIKKYPLTKKNFVKIPQELLTIKSPKCFALAVFIMATAKNSEAYISLSDLSKQTGMSKTTVIKHIKTLTDYGIIAKGQYKTLAGDFGENRFYILPEIIEKMGEARTNRFVKFIHRKVIGFKRLKLIKWLIANIDLVREKNKCQNKRLERTEKNKTIEVPTPVIKIAPATALQKVKNIFKKAKNAIKNLFFKGGGTNLSKLL